MPFTPMRSLAKGRLLQVSRTCCYCPMMELLFARTLAVSGSGMKRAGFGVHTRRMVCYMPMVGASSMVLKPPMRKYMTLFQLYYAAWDCRCRLHLMGAC